MTAARVPPPPEGPGLLDAASLLCEVADELVVRSVRDTHRAVVDRVHVVRRVVTRSGPGPGAQLHRGIADAVYGGLGAGFRAAAKGLDKAAATGAGPRLEQTARGRFVSSLVNGLVGDRLERERPRLAIPLAVRAGGRDVVPDQAGLAAAFPEPTGRLVVLLHGLFESEASWNRHRDQLGTTYGEALAAQGWTPVFLRANTGLSLRENGAALASLLQRVVAHWPVPVTRIALVGHSMGGLVLRAGGAVATEAERPWTELVSDVVTLGTPHLGAPVAWGIGHGSRGMARLPETAAIGRILDWRSVGVHDLVAGLAEDVPPLPHARYRLVAATLTASERHPVGHVVGDLMVRPRSAYGRDRAGRTLFPGRHGAARAGHRPLRSAEPPRRPRGAARLAGVTSPEQDRTTRELHAETVVQAPPDRVWDALVDLGAMARRSPELVRMIPLRPGGLRVGQWYLGINRRKAVVWPTRSVLAVLEPGRVLAWDTTSSGARWIWELEPVEEGRATRVVHRRPVPRGVTLASRVVAPLLLGGSAEHADELEAGMRASVAALKASVEQS